MSLTERHPVLYSVWGVVAVGITAILVGIFGIESTLLVFAVWLTVVFSPFIIKAGWQSTRQRLMRRQQMQVANRERVGG